MRAWHPIVLTVSSFKFFKENLIFFLFCALMAAMVLLTIWRPIRFFPNFVMSTPGPLSATDMK